MTFAEKISYCDNEKLNWNCSYVTKLEYVSLVKLEQQLTAIMPSFKLILTPVHWKQINGTCELFKLVCNFVAASIYDVQQLAQVDLRSASTTEIPMYIYHLSWFN